MSNTQRILKNAGFLYVRMFLIMGVSLYTSRIVLNSLGVSDYGLYNIVGGIVAMFGFINGAMASATQRFLSFDIGKGDLLNLKKTFSASLSVHIIIAIIILLIGETLGLWYVNNKLVVPYGRIAAVNIVYQISLLTLLLNIIQVPYNSLILAREKMAVYTYISFIEVLLKLFVAFLIMNSHTDTLIYYSVLIFTVSFIIRLIYQQYCRHMFKESKYSFEFDIPYIRRIISFTGWNLFGTLSLVFKNQGINIVLNLFFGATINAAYGVVMQVQSSVSQFVSNFQIALNPQIIQNYAAERKDKSLDLILLGSKFSFILMQFISIPVMLNSPIILKLWLGDTVPEFADSFLKLSLASLLIDCVSGPLMTGIQATGKIRLYQILVGCFNLLTLPMTYFLLKIGGDPIVAFFVLIGFSFLSMGLRIVFLKKHYVLTFTMFFQNIVVPISTLLITGYFGVLICNWLINVTGFWTLLLWTFSYSVVQLISVCFLIIKKGQLTTIWKMLKKR